VENAVEGDATLTRAIIVFDGIFASICAAASLIAASRSIPGELLFVSATAVSLLAHPIRIIIKGIMQKPIFFIKHSSTKFYIYILQKSLVLPIQKQ
jgi:hypothetical protein